MTRRDKISFILHIILPAIESEGLTIKTLRNGEITLSAQGAITQNFVQNLRDCCIEELQRPAMPFSPYGA